MSITPNKFEDCHIFGLQSQGNIYTLCRLPNSEPFPRTRLLVASLRRPVFLLEFNHGFKQSLVPYSRELSFTYLPGSAEIVSITAFSKQHSSDTVIGVTYIKVDNTDTGQCLNIFTVKGSGSDFNADGLAFSCSIEINFIPYHLTYCHTLNDSVLVLSGSDNRVHLFNEDSITHFAQEKETFEDFPEFQNEFPSVVLWVEFFITEDKASRLTAVGCECGAIYLFIVDLHNGLAESWNLTHGNSITSCRFFTHNDVVNLIVTNSLLPAMLYRNVMECHLSNGIVLEGSDKHDVITCSLVCDIHMDQQPTILIGTYGQELLVYRPIENSWLLAWQRSFSHPVLAVDYCDVTGDGVCELVALTTRGVHVLQHNLKEVTELFFKRLKAFKRQSSAVNEQIHDTENNGCSSA